MTHAWHDIPQDPATAADGFDAVIEVPKDSKVKYELDKDTGLIRVDRLLHSAVHYPANYGFIPQTYCDDQDPLDVLVLGDDPLVPGCLCEVKAIGVMKMIDGGEGDDKLIGVLTTDPVWRHFNDLSDLPPHLVDLLKQFFLDYKILEKKKTVEITGMLGREDALKVLDESYKLYDAKKDELRG